MIITTDAYIGAINKLFPTSVLFSQFVINIEVVVVVIIWCLDLQLPM